METLKAAPPPVMSSAELLAMAFAMELESARRYRDLADRMQLRREERLVNLFLFLANVEEKHAAHVDERARGIVGISVDPALIRWDVPENFDDEEGSSHLLTPYRALAIAVRNEEKAFAFYSHVAGAAPDAQMQQIAEELAKDELAHAWLLRRERRKAYRRDRSDGQGPRRGELPGSVDALYALAAATEWRASGYHAQLARALSQQGHAAAGIFADIAAEEAMSAKDAAMRGHIVLSAPGDQPPPNLTGGVRLLEEAFERYADIAERTGDETVLVAAQHQAAQAIHQLTRVRGSLRGAGGAETPPSADHPGGQIVG